MKSTSVPVFFSTLAMLLSAKAFATGETCVLTVPGVPGESTSVPNAIDLLTFSWGLHNTTHVGATGGGAGAGRPQFSEFTITKKLDKSSPLLMLASAEGTHYPHATITCRKGGGERQQDYLRFTLSDVVVSSYQVVGSSGNELPTDQISFNFSRVEFNYHPQEPDGSLGPPVNACWDLRTERVCRS
jgi:type VI secretion system secreted protein Hcp